MLLRPVLRRPSRLAAVSGAVLALALLAGCSGDDEPDAASDPAAATSSEESSASGETCEYPADGREPSKPVDPPPSEAGVSGDVSLTISTGVGDIGATLDADATPCTVNSFVSLAEQGYFDDTSCHRLTTQGIFVLQCGDPTGTGTGGPGYSFPDELTGEETYPAGTLAMANAGPNTNGSQFFIVYDDTQLPPAYTVFGTVDDAGLQVVQDVAKQGVEDGAADGAPAEPVDIETVTVD